jgi:penicillin G amidase
MTPLHPGPERGLLTTNLVPPRFALGLAGVLSLLLVLPGCEEPDRMASPGASDVEALAESTLAQLEGEISLDGLNEPVEILRDEWGIPHIYAENLDDLFFAQGFVQAQDRLWQMVLWRHFSEGRLSELIGPEGLDHDRQMRLFQYRGPWDAEEFQSYHPEAERIATAFSAGVNAFLAHRADNLPMEFQVTGVEPDEWEPHISFLRPRVGQYVGQARRQLNLAMQVAEHGPEEANRLSDPRPWVDLTIPDGLDVSLINEAALEALGGNMYGQYLSGNLREQFLGDAAGELLQAMAEPDPGSPELWPGSNNWAVSGELSGSGRAMLAADPHRQVTNPALRLLIHLNAPGWNSFGMTEPQLPGVYVGHNGRMAWGRTAAGNHIGDVYVEEVNPEDPDQVLFNGEWEQIEIVEDTIRVRGGSDEVVELRYSRHGPIFYQDSTHHRAYALKSPMHMRGSAEFIGALHLNQAESAQDCMHPTDVPLVPPTSLVCADDAGNIAFRNAGMQPDRDGWYGRMPVPGTGRYEWNGFRDDLPSEFNPDRGWVATANHDIQPPDLYPPIYFGDRARYRFERIEQVLSQGSGFTIEDFKALQLDALNLEAVEHQDDFVGWSSDDEDVEWAREELAGWDHRMERESRAAALWIMWRGEVDLSELAQSSDSPRQAMVEEGLVAALASLESELGSDRAEWRWGRLHRSTFPHTLLPQFDMGEVERRGGAGTVAATGAVFRQIVDFSDIDATVGTLAPGQSMQPGSPFYDNLLPLWAEDEYIPYLFSRDAVEERTSYRLRLQSNP